MNRRFAPLLLLLATPVLAQEHLGPTRAMTFRDVMQFQSLYSPVISDNGAVVAFEVRPDRGDGAAWIRTVATGKTIKITRGKAPKITAGGRFALTTVVAPFDSKGKDKPKNALAIANVETGNVEMIPDVERYAVSDDGKFLAWLLFAKKSKSDKKSKRTVGTTLVLHKLGEGEHKRIDHVTRFGFAPDSSWLTYIVCTPDGKENALCHRGLKARGSKRWKAPGHVVGRFAWNKVTPHFAYTIAKQKDDGELEATTLKIEDETIRGRRGKPTFPKITAKDLGRGYVLRNDTDLAWTKDGRRLLFSAREKQMEDLVAANAKRKKDAAKKQPTADAYDVKAILEDREVDVWHYREPLINPHQKKTWAARSKRSYRCVFDLETKTTRRLADPNLPQVSVRDGSDIALGRSTKFHERQITWDGRYTDYWLIDIKTGKRKRALFRHAGAVSLSPKGHHLAYFFRGHWWLMDGETTKRRIVTHKLRTPFANEDHDYPRAVPGYGVAGWLPDESAVLLYDKFDVWSCSVQDGSMRCITGGWGRDHKTQLRVVKLDRESDHIDPTAALLLTGFDEEDKGWSMLSCDLTKGSVKVLLDTDDRLRVIGKAKHADRILYTREDYDRFPDLHVANLDLSKSEQVTTFDTQRKPFHWGNAELIDWRSIDGKRMQGAVIKPGNYDPTKRYPVLVYYYRFFSQRVNEWNQIAVNHRPCFPFWASNGYVVFLPDIRFDIGRPGYAATKCLVPGVQKLVDLGIADPKKIALHGHSWSGYQTAFVITQSNLFACAIAGAPVSNMTSAYGGIRWGSGLSRQFQYEKTQSRIGGSLWEYPERYIENSPLFFADRIQTPLLIQFGDADGAVPWYQGIELYMAMRRLDKPCVFLQYRNEPHHLKKYANKLDYSVRFKEYVDHYCRGTRPPKWIRSGEPYSGR